MLQAADLDEWVAYDGGTIIVMHGAGGQHPNPDADVDSGDLRTPVVVSPPDETVVSIA